MATLSDSGPVARHMNHNCNPLSKLDRDAKSWQCPPTDQLKSMDAFYATYNKESQCLLAEGGQSNIYTINKKNSHRLGPSKLVIAKFYDTSKHAETLQSVWTEYVLIKSTKLLKYDDLYYDEREQKAVIISEPLHYTLREYVQRIHANRSITEYECKLIVLDILCNLWTTHRSGFIHNDLNPDNIMHCSDDYRQTDSTTTNGWKLIDYGLILSTKCCAANKYRYKGTRGWTAPEIVPESTQNQYSIAKDIWSLGLIIIYILCKQQPYTLSGYEQSVLCKKDRFAYKQYFYYNKLLQQTSNKNIVGKPKTTRFKKFMMKSFKPNPAKVKCAEDLSFKAGELFLRKYLMKLYETNQISYHLCNLLMNYMLNFDASKRLNCAQIYKHKWFDDVRHL